MNQLYYGDNLTILREYIPAESVDLIYLDPPFNSNRNYNILFKEESGEQSAAQLTAFEDTWHWDINTEGLYQEMVTSAEMPPQVSSMIAALRNFIGTNPMMAYLVNMSVRLVELHRVLKPSGSLYLHCDPTASHYLKIVLDAIFGFENVQNDITWKRSDTHNDAKKRFSAISDQILFYTKSSTYTFSVIRIPNTDSHILNWFTSLELADGTIRRMTKEEKQTGIIPPGSRRFSISDLSSPNPRPNLMYEYKGYPYPPKGWRVNIENMQKLDSEGYLLFPKTKSGRIVKKKYLDELEGIVLGNIWSDITQLRAQDAERLGYPTQKPQALLERIISASSNPGDVVLDPFCGCGTAVAAAQALGRRWIGIDITHLSIALIKYRIEDAFPDAEFEVLGEPQSVQDARYLAENSRHQFEWWALSLVRARPAGGDGGKTGKKGADRGIDGIINFIDAAKGAPKQIIVQVKSGHVSSAHIRDLVGTLERTKAAIGVYLTLEEPTAPMRKEAAEAGFYHSDLWNRDYPRVQIYTIEELLSGAAVQMPPTSANVTFQRAQRQKGEDSTRQPDLFG